MSIKVVKSRCPENHRCPVVNYCPTGAISQNGYSAPEINMEKCTSCGRCTMVCPSGAIQGR